MSNFEIYPRITRDDELIGNLFSGRTFETDDFNVKSLVTSDYPEQETILGDEEVTRDLPVAMIGTFVTLDNDIVSASGINRIAEDFFGADAKEISFYAERDLLFAQKLFKDIDFREAFEVIDGLGGYDLSNFSRYDEGAVFLGGLVTYLRVSTKQGPQMLRSELVANRGLQRVKSTIDKANEHTFNISDHIDYDGDTAPNDSLEAVLDPEVIDKLNVYAFGGERYRETIGNIAVLATLPSSHTFKNRITFGRPVITSEN